MNFVTSFCLTLLAIISLGNVSETHDETSDDIRRDVVQNLHNQIMDETRKTMEVLKVPLREMKEQKQAMMQEAKLVRRMAWTEYSNVVDDFVGRLSKLNINNSLNLPKLANFKALIESSTRDVDAEVNANMEKVKGCIDRDIETIAQATDEVKKEFNEMEIALQPIMYESNLCYAQADPVFAKKKNIEVKEEFSWVEVEECLREQLRELLTILPSHRDGVYNKVGSCEMRIEFVTLTIDHCFDRHNLRKFAQKLDKKISNLEQCINSKAWCVTIH